jgi:hypothetical protein
MRRRSLSRTGTIFGNDRRAGADKRIPLESEAEFNTETIPLGEK